MNISRIICEYFSADFPLPLNYPNDSRLVPLCLHLLTGRQVRGLITFYLYYLVLLIHDSILCGQMAALETEIRSVM